MIVFDNVMGVNNEVEINQKGYMLLNLEGPRSHRCSKGLPQPARAAFLGCSTGVYVDRAL
jgi:hypothetical protein